MAVVISVDNVTTATSPATVRNVMFRNRCLCSVGQLVFELGYTSESAFSNAFKREVGMSPTRYRASIRDELADAESESV